MSVRQLEFISNITHLVNRAGANAKDKGIDPKTIPSVIIDELKLIVQVLIEKKKVKHDFQIIKVDMRKARYQTVIVSSLFGFTMTISKEYVETFINWVNTEVDENDNDWWLNQMYYRYGIKEIVRKRFPY